MAVYQPTTADEYQKSFPPLPCYDHKNPKVSLLQKIQEHRPNYSRFIGLLTLLTSCTILLLLAGVTLTTTVLALVFFTPFVLVASPIWVPIGIVLFVIIVGLLSVCGLGMASVTSLSWLYWYFRGFRPIGSDRVDYARGRIADTAIHVKDYAREYGGYLQSKVKDAAPGA